MKKKPIRYVLFTKRTDDPKLRYIEFRLDAAKIPHRRNGHSFHGPILEVAEEHEQKAWEILSERIDISRGGKRPYTRCLDDIADDHPIFREW